MLADTCRGLSPTPCHCVGLGSKFDPMMQPHFHASHSNARGALRSLPPNFHIHVQLYTTVSSPLLRRYPTYHLDHCCITDRHSTRNGSPTHLTRTAVRRVVWFLFVAARCARDFCSWGDANPCRTPPLSTVDRKCVVPFSRSTALIASLCLYLRRVSQCSNLP